MRAPAGWTGWREHLAARLSCDPLADPAVRRKAALVLVDDLAAMVGASGHAEPQALAATLTGRGGDEATVVAGGRAGREQAAAANAVAAAWDELDEGYRPATCHGGLYTVPAACAEAEATGRSLDELLAAVVRGYELVTAVARLLPTPKPLVLHPHATLAPIGAAAAVAALRGADATALLGVADAASTLAMVGPFRHATDGLQVRNTWAAAGAVTGFLTADAAAAGLTADDTTLLDVFADALGQPLDPVELAARPEGWAVLDGYHKPYAACQYTHAALEATAELTAAGDVDLAGVREVLVETHPLALALTDAAPRTALGGKFSVPHVVAAVLATGSSEASTFSAARLDDPRVADLRGRVSLAPFEPLPAAPHDRPARVTLRLADGRTLERTVLSAAGGPDRPLTSEQVLGKAAGLTAERAPRFAARAADLVAGDGGDRPWAEVLADLLERP